MKPRSLVALAALALAAVPIAPAQVRAEGEGYTFRVRYVPGAVVRYKGKTNVTITGGPEGLPGPQEVEVDLKQEVVGVENGIATLKIETTTTTARTGGGTPEPTTQTIRVDERGRTVDESGKPTAASGSGFTSSLPEGAIKVGGTWITETDAPGGAGKIKVASTFAGIEKGEERSLARVEFKMDSEGAADLDGAGTVTLDAADGQLVSMKLDSKTTVDVPGGDGPLTVSIAMTIERV